MSGAWLDRRDPGRWLAALAAASVMALALGWSGVAAQQPSGSPDVPADLQATPLQQGECLDFGTVRTARHRKTRALRYIGSQPGRPIRRPFDTGARVAPDAAAREYLSWCGSLFGVSNAGRDLAVTETRARSDRGASVRFQQLYRNIPVMGGELVVNLDGAQSILSTVGRVLPRARIATTRPTVTAASAANQALDLAAKWHDVPREILSATPPVLWIYSPTLIGPDDGPPVLVWRTEVTPSEPLPIRETILIDAATGALTLHFNQAETALNRQTHTASNGTSLPGTLVCNETNPTCSGGDTHAVSAHLAAADTYNFYLSNHGRDSINNAGMALVQTVHYSSGYVNAFWNGSQMVYGDGAGFALADDVVGHELTHGVTDYTSDLFYYYQSGAINESFSDVWGEFVDLTNGRGNDASSVKWLMGEDVSGLGALRDMKNPPVYGDPDRMTSPYYYTGSGDNGGVHSNSGINNKAAVLMVDGGTFNGQTITALGITKVAKIYYEVQTHLLTSGSDYADLYDALYQGCSNLVGTAGITSSDCEQVRKATIATEMNLQPIANFNPDAPVCVAGFAPINLFYDQIEAGGGNFTTIVTSGSNRWSTTTGYAHSGTRSLYGSDYPATVTSSAVATVSPVTLPANAYLHFFHAFGFEEPAYDGGVVEYTTNNGGTWLDAGSLFDNVGYNGTIAAGWGNPLAGRSAFVGPSHGYRSSRLNLSPLAGQSVRFRWRLGLDNIGSSLGWLVDDVRIYTCVSLIPQAPTIATIANQSTLEDVAKTLAVTVGDADTPLSAVSLTGTSSNLAVLPLSGISIAGAGATRTLTLTPAANQSGATTITLTANDGGLTATRTFDLTVTAVNDTPTLSTISPQVVTPNSATGTLSFMVSDVETAAASLVVTATSSNTTLVPNANITLGGSGANRTVMVTPAAAQTGRSAITLAASDGSATGTTTFELIVPSPGTVVVDTFTDASGTLLSAHTPDFNTTGAPWVVTGHTPIPRLAAGGVGIGGAGGGHVQATINSGLPDVIVAADFTIGPAAYLGAVVVRVVDADNHLLLVAYGGTLHFYRKQLGEYILLGSAPLPMPVSVGTTHRLEARTAGNVLQGWWDGAQLLQVTSGFQQQATRHGLDWNSAYDTTARFDNLEIRSSVPPPAAPSNASPASGVGSVEVGSALTWTAPGATTYDIAFGTANPPSIAATGLTAASFTPAMAGSTTYYWQVIARNSGGTATGPIWSFTTAVPPPAPGTPGTASPAPAAANVAVSGTSLTWSATGATSYDVAFGTTNPPSTIATNLSTATYTPALVWSTTYYWRVTAKNGGGTTVGPVWTFTTTGPPAGQVVWDQFTDVNGTAISAHAPDFNTSGAPWLVTGSTPIPRLTNGRVGITAGGGHLQATINSGLADVIVAADYTIGPGTYLGAVVVRVIDAENHVLLVAYGGTLHFYRRQLGEYILLGSAPLPAPLSVGTTHRLEARTVGNVLQGWWDGAQLLQVTSSFQQQATRHGLDWNSAYDSTATFDNFEIRSSVPPPAAPGTPSPATGASAVALGGALTWTAAGATSYDIAVGTSSPPSTVATNLTSASFTPSLAGSTTYYWQVIARNAAGTTAGPIWSFTTAVPPPPPGTPGSASPTTTATNVAISDTTLTWSATGATSYDVAFGTTNPPSTVATNLSSATYTPGLVWSTTYYWRVTARNGGGTTVGPVWTFTTAGPPAGQVVWDQFTDVNGTAISAHAPDFNTSGAPWVVTGSTPIPRVTNGRVGITAGGGHLQATINSGLTDVIVAADYTIGPGTYLGAVVVRVIDAENHLLLVVYGGTLHFYRKQLGEYILLGSAPLPAPLSVGTTHRLEARTVGNVLQGWWDGAQLLQVTSSFQQQATRHGLDWNSAYDATATFDNFEIRSSVPPPAAPGTPSPATGASAVALGGALTWTAAGATSYDIAVGTSSPPSIVATNIPGASFTPSLAGSTTYYWQVIAKNATGTTAGPIWSFTTAVPPPPPGTPGSASPTTTATNVAISDTSLTWGAAGATSYDVAFGTTNPPSTIATNLSTATYTPALVWSTTYYWRVTAKNGGGTTVGPVWTFTTAGPPAGQVVWDQFTDVNGTAISAHAPDFNTSGAPWVVTGSTPIPRVTNGRVGITPGGGHLQATINSGLADVIVAADYTIGPGTYLGAVVVRVIDAENHLLLVAYGGRLHFYRRQLGEYILLGSAPLPAPLSVGTTHRLEARTVGNVLQGWWDGSLLLQVNSSFQQQATRHGLDWNSAYDATATFDNFEIRSSVPPPAVPASPSPASGAGAVALGGALTWSADGATSYDIAVGTSSPPSIVASNIISASFTPSLAGSTTYYWQVIAKNSAGTTAGPIWTFTTAVPPPAPGTPITPSPAAAATNVAVTGTSLAWSTTGATSYDVAFGTTNPPSTVATNLSSATYTPGLVWSTTYYWRVTAKNGGGATVGPVWTFTTAAPPAGQVVWDQFTDVNGTAISAHAPDFNTSGAPWVVTGSTPIPRVTNGRVGITAGGGHLQATINSGLTDVIVAADYTIGPGTYLGAVVVRVIDAENHLLLVAYGGTLHFYRKQLGEYILLGSAPLPAPLSIGTTHRLEARTVGNVLQGWWDGSLLLQVNSSFQQQATRHGLDWNSAYDATATFDNFEIRANTSPVVFRDDFNGSSLTPGRWSVPTGAASYIPKTQFRAALPAVAGGVVRLTLDRYNPTALVPGDSFLGTDMLSSELFDRGGGLTFRARARIVGPMRSGLVGGLFLYHTSNGVVRDEIDFELVTKQAKVLTNAYSDAPFNAGGAPEYPSLPGFDLTAFNDYEIRWLSDRIQWRVNGQLVRELMSGVPDGAMRVHLNFWAPHNQWLDAYDATLVPVATAAANQQFVFEVDYVEVSRQ